MFIIYQKNFSGPQAPAADFIILMMSKTYDRSSMQDRLHQLGFEAALPKKFTALEEEIETPLVNFDLGIAQCAVETKGSTGETKTPQTRIERDGATWKHITEWVDLPAAANPTYRKQVSRTEYYGLFTPQEEAMIRLAASEDVTPALLAAANTAEKTRLMGVASIAVMLRRTDALGADDRIDLTNQQVMSGLDLLETAQLLTAARKEQILRGVPE